LLRVEAEIIHIRIEVPQKEEEAVRLLSAIAKDLSVEIGSIRLQPKVDFSFADGKQIFDQKKCQVVIVSINMKSYYKNFIDYLEKLKESLPAVVTVESLTISKAGADSAKLNITMNLKLYLLS